VLSGVKFQRIRTHSYVTYFLTRDNRIFVTSPFWSNYQFLNLAASNIAFDTLFCSIATSTPSSYCWLDISGTPYCVSPNTALNTTAPANVKFKQIVMGVATNEFVCGLALTNRTYCWGFSNIVSPPASMSFQSINSNICGLLFDGTIYCWIVNPKGPNSTTPVSIVYFSLTESTSIYQACGFIQGCAACSPGTYSLNPGQTSCQDCLLGKYASDFGSTTCLSCPEGFYCPQTYFVPVDCPAGFYCVEKQKRKKILNF